MSALAFVRPDILRLAAYVPGEQPRDRRYIKLNTNENPYPPSPRVLDALRSAVTGDLRLYPDPLSTALRVKAAAVYGTTADQILVGNGSDDLLTMIMRTCVGPGDRVVYPVPTYSLYETLVAIQGGAAVEVPFPPDFTLPVEELGEQGQKVTIVCNPNAPSGTLTPVAVIERLASRLRGLLVIDEAYVDFAGETALRLVHSHDNVLVLRTFSKSFALCGLRVGLAFGSPEVIAALAKVKDSYNVNRLGAVAAEAALDDCPWMAKSAANVCATRRVLLDGLGELEFQCLPSQANFVLARRPGVDLKPLLNRLKDEGILVRHFATPALRDALRITVGTPEEIAALLASPAMRPGST
jgi:histidinol-phosphate aminotransferase